MKPVPRTQHPPKRTVLIGSEPLLAAWRTRTGDDDVIAVALTDLAAVTETIGSAQPEVVVIEQAVAAGAPGSTLMDRLHAERFLRGIEVWLLPPDGAATLMAEGVPGTLNPQAWLAALTHALPPRPERRARRIPATADEQALINGEPAALIDLSAVGAQVRSQTVLKPRQRIRLVLPPERGSVRAVAVVAWSTFEITPTPTYRAGVAFTRAISDPA